MSGYSRVVLDRVGAIRHIRDMRWIVGQASRRDGTGHSVQPRLHDRCRKAVDCSHDRQVT